MNDMYQVRAYVDGTTVRGRRPIFMTVHADNAKDAKAAAKKRLLETDPGVKIKKLTATPVF